MDMITSGVDFVVQNLLAEFVTVVAGVLFAQFIQRRWERRKYGNWRVEIRRDGGVLVEREISDHKAKDILSEPADLSVFLKGVVSPYGRINCDLVTEGKELGLLVQNDDARKFVIDLDKNPEDESSSSTESIR